MRGRIDEQRRKPLADRRKFLIRGAVAGVALALPAITDLYAESPSVLDLAYAGSMSTLMEGAVKQAVRKSLQIELHGRGQGASALAQLIVSGSIAPDVFMPITGSPMLAVLHAGKAVRAEPIARTEMVIAYSPKSRFAAKLNAVVNGRGEWWKVLQEPGLRFGRTDPAADPQGRNILFTMMLAAKKYGQPDLVERIVGPMINPQQISMEANVQARLQSGELDAASAYKIQPSAFHLPYVTLPPEINLSGEHVHTEHPEISLSVGGKTYVPEPLIYYAATLTASRNAREAHAFVAWLRGGEAQAIFRENAYDGPGSAEALHL